MTPAEARQALASVHCTVADLVDLLIKLGDTRNRATIERCCHNIMAEKRANDVPWSVHLMVYFLTMYKKEEKKNEHLSELLATYLNKPDVLLQTKKPKRAKHEQDKNTAGDVAAGSESPAE
jgi:hypothetical protein